MVTVASIRSAMPLNDAEDGRLRHSIDVGAGTEVALGHLSLVAVSDERSGYAAAEKVAGESRADHRNDRRQRGAGATLASTSRPEAGPSDSSNQPAGSPSAPTTDARTYGRSAARRHLDRAEYPAAKRRRQPVTAETLATFDGRRQLVGNSMSAGRPG